MGILCHWSFFEECLQNFVVQTVSSITLRLIVQRERLLRTDIGLLDMTVSGLCSVAGFGIDDVECAHSATTA
jgi:hypothetical protein